MCVICVVRAGVPWAGFGCVKRTVRFLDGQCWPCTTEFPPLFLPLFLQIVFCSRSPASQPCLLLQRHEFVRTVAAQRLAPLEASGPSV